MHISIPKELIRKSGIYVIKNTIDHKIYIGSAADFYVRIRKHKYLIENGKCHNMHLKYFIEKYGHECLYIEVVELVPNKNNLIAREQHYLDELQPFQNNGFNVLKFAGSCLGSKQSAETKRKRSLLWLGNTFWKGKKHTDEYKALMSHE
jgi:group I intron endonuclease